MLNMVYKHYCIVILIVITEQIRNLDIVSEQCSASDHIQEEPNVFGSGQEDISILDINFFLQTKELFISLYVDIAHAWTTLPWRRDPKHEFYCNTVMVFLRH